jgi:hypothetical protein
MSSGESIEESDRLNELHELRLVKEAATNLLMAMWRASILGYVPDRGPVFDSALELRDLLNPEWPNNSDWLPEPLASEREAGFPKLQ